jgi:predicted glycoside hydrolase/deacetylase ChbG (UPF0249 family)
MKPILCLLFCFLFLASFSQTDTTYAERLLFPKGKKVVILHIDDAGMSFDSNKGVTEALTKGVANSVSVMMPCPWVPGFVRFLKENPKLDAGLHLTLTSEWRDYRWVPLSGKPKVPGLVDTTGAMWAGVQDVVQHASADEVEWEIRAQLERALAMGFKPTHLDSHMGTLFATPAFIERYIKLGIENKIPVMFPAGHNTLIKAQMGADDSRLQMARSVGKMLWAARLPVLDDLHNESYGWSLPAGMKGDEKTIAREKTKYYINALSSLKPGITMVIMHCTSPTEVFPHISDSGVTRQGDLLAMLDPALRAYIQKEGIILTTWRELMERRSKLAL